jgi:hypothetical protein
VLFYCTSMLFLVGLKMAGHGRKNVAKYNLIVIIASYLDMCYLLTVHNILYRFDNTQRDGLTQVNRKSLRSSQ